MTASAPLQSACHPHWEERLCIVAGRRIGYRECGSGPAVVLLHGIGSGAGSWELLATLLMQRVRVIAWDAPGYGNSDTLAVAGPAASDYARALHGFVGVLGLQRFVLVGHSLGAMMAAAYAAAHPLHVQELVLADPAQGYAGSDPRTRKRVRNERVRLLEKLGTDAYAEQRAGSLLRQHPTPEALQTVKASMRRLRGDGFAQACAMLAEDDIWLYLSQWSGPVQVLCGDKDDITPPDAAALLARRLKAPFRRLPAAGHASYLDAPASFARSVLEAARAINTSRSQP